MKTTEKCRRCDSHNSHSLQEPPRDIGLKKSQQLIHCLKHTHLVASYIYSVLASRPTTSMQQEQKAGTCFLQKIAPEVKQTYYNIHLLFRYSKMPNQCGMWLHCGNYVNLGELFWIFVNWRERWRIIPLSYCLQSSASLYTTNWTMPNITVLWESMEISGIQ